MSTLNMNIIKIRRYLESVPTLNDELQQDRIYTDIIENTVKGLVSQGSGTENDHTKIDIDFVGALMAVPSAERLFHSHGIVMDEFHFYRKGSSQIARREFDLKDSRFPLPLALRRCTFTETLDLRRSRLASLDLTGSILPALMLEGARIDGRLILDETHLTFGKAEGRLSLEQSVARDFRDAANKHQQDAPRAGLDANDLVTGDRVSLKKSLVRGGIRLRRARIGGDFVARQAAIISRRYAQAACLESRGQCQLCLKTLREKLINDELNTLKIDDKSGWKQVRINFNDTCRDAALEPLDYNPDELAFDALHLREAHVKGTVELTDGFISLGEVSLDCAQVDGGVFCRGGMFFQHDGVALSMDEIKVGGSVYLDQYRERTPLPDGGNPAPVRFIAHGTVSMRGAAVEHRLVITKAHFLKQHNGSSSHGTWPPCDPLRERESYAFFAKRLKVGGDVFFNKDASRGAATDNKCGRICLENAHIGGRLFLAARPADSSAVDFVDLGFAQVAAAAYLEIRPTAKPKCRVCLRSARVGSLDVSACAHQWVTWDLQGLHYDAIEKVEHVTLDGTAKPNPDWVTVWTDAILQERGTLSTGAVQPFDALMAFLRELGRDEAAGDVGIAKEHKITDNIKMMASLHKSGKRETTNHLGITKESEINPNIRKSARKTGPLFHAVHLAWRWVIRTLVGNRHDHV